MVIYAERGKTCQHDSPVHSKPFLMDHLVTLPSAEIEMRISSLSSPVPCSLSTQRTCQTGDECFPWLSLHNETGFINNKFSKTKTILWPITRDATSKVNIDQTQILVARIKRGEMRTSRKKDNNEHEQKKGRGAGRRWIARSWLVLGLYLVVSPFPWIPAFCWTNIKTLHKKIHGFQQLRKYTYKLSKAGVSLLLRTL